MLFLNKRGSARLLVCQQCGWFATCDRCDLPYTYHGDNHTLRCHTCGRQRSAPNSCEDCGSSDIIFKSPGTKAIETAIRSLFPDSRIARFDKDNTKDERFSAQASAVASGEIDILIGTQLLAKGHDLPKLSLVGILMADNELQFPDFSSEERSYQLLHQLAGRVGRGHRDGTVVVQTYNPKSISIQDVQHDKDSWELFYKNQLVQRKQFFFPPFCFLLKIEVQRAKSENAERICTSIAEKINQDFKSVAIVGPTPSFIARRNGQWSWQLIIKSPNRGQLLAITKILPPKTTFDIDPISLL
jgi:primosomal protein N' (replication factor Y)